MTQEQLLERCVRRDRTAWDEFVRQHEGLVRRAVRGKINRMNSKSLLGEADDIVQEVFLMLWRDNRLKNVRRIESLKGWLAIVAINKTIDYTARRREERRRTKSMSDQVAQDGFTLEDLIPARGKDQEKVLEVKELRETLLKKISTLGDKERRVFELRLHGEKEGEIAGIMGIPECTVSTIIRRGKKKLMPTARPYVAA